MLGTREGMKGGAEGGAIHLPYHCPLWISGRFEGSESSLGNVGRFPLCQCFPNFDLCKYP